MGGWDNIRLLDLEDASLGRPTLTTGTGCPAPVTMGSPDIEDIRGWTEAADPDTLSDREASLMVVSSSVGILMQR